jgi:hypothetical protein
MTGPHDDFLTQLAHRTQPKTVRRHCEIDKGLQAVLSRLRVYSPTIRALVAHLRREQRISEAQQRLQGR